MPKPVAITTTIGPVFVLPEQVGAISPTSTPGVTLIHLLTGPPIAAGATAKEIAKAIGWDLPGADSPGQMKLVT